MLPIYEYEAFVMFWFCERFSACFPRFHLWAFNPNQSNPIHQVMNVVWLRANLEFETSLSWPSISLSWRWRKNITIWNRAGDINKASKQTIQTTCYTIDMAWDYKNDEDFENPTYRVAWLVFNQANYDPQRTMQNGAKKAWFKALIS